MISARLVRKPPIIDAEFTVVGEAEPRKPLRREPGWNGYGLPPEWASWGWLPRLAFIATWLAIMVPVWVFAHWIARVIVPPVH